LIFNAYHATPTEGHFGEYKTLHRIRLRFFWPGCRKDINRWIIACPECILSNSKTHRGSELIYSWPVSTPFYIIHVDIWSPGDTTSARGYSHFLAAMCDLTGFVIIAELTDLSAATLAVVFMQQVLLTIGMCGLVVPDAGSAFLGLFQTMCHQMDLPHDPTAKGNHKAVLV